MSSQKVRVSADIYEKIKYLADKSGLSMRDVVEKAILGYYYGTINTEGKDIKGITGKIIQLKFPAKCSKCGKQLSSGDFAYWSKVVYTDNTVKSWILCLDCYHSDTGLKEQYLKKYRLKKVVKELRKEADKLAEQVLDLRAYIQVKQLLDEYKQLAREIYTALDLAVDPDRRQALMKLAELLERAHDSVKRLEDQVIAMEETIGQKYRIKKAKPQFRR